MDVVALAFELGPNLRGVAGGFESCLTDFFVKCSAAQKLFQLAVRLSDTLQPLFMVLWQEAAELRLRQQREVRSQVALAQRLERALAVAILIAELLKAPTS